LHGDVFDVGGSKVDRGERCPVILPGKNTIGLIRVDNIPWHITSVPNATLGIFALERDWRQG